MDKYQIIEDFFRSLRITLTNAFSYSKNHPYFLKSVENLNLKLKETLGVINPFIIGVTSQGFVVEEMNLIQVGFYDELARIFHQRKIKSIKISSGVTFSELVSFLSVVSMAQKDILKNGGVNILLGKNQLVNFTIEELDYSEFLYGEGEECSDVWSHLLKDATQANDEIKINQLTRNFDTLIKRTNQNDIFETPELPATINDFLICLKNKDKEKFSKCSKDLFLWLIQNKKSINDEKITKLIKIFDSLNHEDFSTLFWDGLMQEESLDSLSLHFFSKITEQKDSAQIVQGVFNNTHAVEYLNGNPRVVKRIQDLLACVQDDHISSVYRNTLEHLVKGISSTGVLSFDQKSLRENYRYIVLNMLSMNDSEDKDNLWLAAEVLEKELVDIFGSNDLGFLKDLSGLLEKRKKEGNNVCTVFEEKFSIFIENIVLSQPLSAEQECILEMVSLPRQGVDFYLDKIFIFQKADKQALFLFLKFFSDHLDLFYQRMGTKLQDIEFISSLVDALGQLDSFLAIEILERIYFSTSELIKLEILNIMCKFKKVDVRFLISQLNTDSSSLRKSLLSVLILDASAGGQAIDLLLKIPSFCGRKNNLLIENMQIIFNLGLVQAAGQINDLSRRRFFWNQKLRAKAEHILKEWNAH